MKKSRSLLTAALGAIFASLCFVISAFGQQLTVGNLEKVSETRVGRTIFEYVMRAKLTNPGPAFPANEVAGTVSL